MLLCPKMGLGEIGAIIDGNCISACVKGLILPLPHHNKTIPFSSPSFSKLDISETFLLLLQCVLKWSAVGESREGQYMTPLMAAADNQHWHIVRDFIEVMLTIIYNGL